MPRSPSRNVMRLWPHAVFMYAGSYDIIPKSSGFTLIWRRSIARMFPSVMGKLYSLLVRLSLTNKVSLICVGSSAAARYGFRNMVPDGQRRLWFLMGRRAVSKITIWRDRRPAPASIARSVALAGYALPFLGSHVAP